MAQSYELDVSLDSSGVEQGAQSATQALSGLAGQAGLVSTALKTAGVAAVAFAGYQGLQAAVSSAATFEEQMLSLRSTVGESAQTVRNMRDNVMELSAETGESTKQIVDGFRFARSAGLRMARAQELVETSTKASAAGFGEQNELVRTATTAMNTWSSEVESGADFLNTMAAAAQNADIRVSEMSGAFRRNVNIASQLGLELEETLGSLSAISGAVGSASRGGRLFQQVLAGLLKPTQQASDVISGAVGSVDNLHESIREDGLVQALLQLQQSLNRNGKEMSDVFRSTRRLEGALALIANEGERARDITNQAAEATNTIGNAFENTDGTLRQWQQTQQTFNNALIRLGDNILPGVNFALGETNDWINDISDKIDRFEKGVNGLSKAFDDLEEATNIDIPERVLQMYTIITDPTGAAADFFTSQTKEAYRKLAGGGQSGRKMSVHPGQTMSTYPEESIPFNDPFSDVGTGGDFWGSMDKVFETKGEQAATSFGDGWGRLIAEEMQFMERTKIQSLPEQFATGTLDSASGLSHRMGLDQTKEKFDELEDNARETFTEMESLARNWGSSFSRTTAEMLATGEANFKKLGQTFIQDFLEVIVQRMVTNRALNLLLQGSMSGSSEKGFLPTGLNFMGNFFDTPGVQEVGPQGGAAGFAPGDKFVAGKSEKSMRQQLSGGASGGTTVNQSVENNFPVVSDQQIDRRIQKAAPRIAEQAKRETLNALRGGGSEAQTARNA